MVRHHQFMPIEKLSNAVFDIDLFPRRHRELIPNRYLSLPARVFRLPTAAARCDNGRQSIAALEHVTAISHPRLLSSPCGVEQWHRFLLSAPCSVNSIIWCGGGGGCGLVYGTTRGLVVFLRPQAAGSASMFTPVDLDEAAHPEIPHPDRVKRRRLGLAWLPPPIRQQSPAGD